ncbi:hypothetical protein [Streptomyces sp. MUM 2J]|uniref:hypothetical protein n=1 Tax=Streptomyces sp. MUM 2J TaxID=2791987 RepID=UPI001F04BABF|nr:hypothetical protein [Streptomyces sp. MUM 2J]
MEQRRGSSSQPLKAEPVTGAGFDPAFIPGLTTPASAAPGGTVNAADVEDAAPEEPSAAEPSGPADDGAGESAGEPAESPAEDTRAGESAGEPAERALDGPVFEAADRRARIVADRNGVALALDDQACEFRWDEIGAIETATARFGKRFTVTVHTPDRRWYPIEVEATSRSEFPEWESRLDAVLDAYFEDDAATGEAAATEDGAATEDTTGSGDSSGAAGDAASADADGTAEGTDAAVADAGNTADGGTGTESPVGADTDRAGGAKKAAGAEGTD